MLQCGLLIFVFSATVLTNIAVTADESTTTVPTTTQDYDAFQQVTYGCRRLKVQPDGSGIIQSPYYDAYDNGKYQSGSKCRWEIPRRNGTNIRMSFSDAFSLRRVGDFCMDYVAILPRSIAESTEVCSRSTSRSNGTFCGFVPPESFVVGEDGVIVEFCVSDEPNLEHQGFQLRFEKTADAVTPVPGLPRLPCGHSALLLDKTLVHISTPSKYPVSVICTWQITLNDTGKNFLINAQEFDLLPKDSLTVSVNPANESEQGITYEFSGRRGPLALRLPGTVLTFTLVTGFHLNATAQGFGISVQKSGCQDDAGYCVNNVENDVCFTGDMMCNGKPECPEGIDETCQTGCGIPPVSPVLNQGHTRILGGTEAKPHSWPWQAAFVVLEQLLPCSGSIIDQSWILTTADCCERLQSAFQSDVKSVAIHTGMHDFTAFREVNAATYRIEKMEYLAEEADPLAPTSRSLNYCLVKKMFFNEHVRPVCLAKENPPADTHCYTTGWGKTQYTDAQDLFKGSATLQQVEQTITYGSSCLLGLNNTMIDKMLNVSICGGDSDKRGCMFDEGGPLVCRNARDASQWELVGLTGRVILRTCHPDDLTQPHYIRVTNALEWIKAVTGVMPPGSSSAKVTAKSNVVLSLAVVHLAVAVLKYL